MQKGIVSEIVLKIQEHWAKLQRTCQRLRIHAGKKEYLHSKGSRKKVAGLLKKTFFAASLNHIMEYKQIRSNFFSKIFIVQTE